MQNVTPAFNTAAEATVRNVVSKVDIVWASPFIDTAVTAVANDENRLTNTPQVHDGTRNILRLWAHLDGVIKADGTHNPMPGNPDNSPSNQVGWYGATECNGSNIWVTDPVLTLTFDARPIHDLLVVGDSMYDEYPTDFDVEVYEDVTLVYTANVTGNSAVEWLLDVRAEAIDNATKMVLTVKKWSAPNRIVKISEFYSILKETYDGDTVSSINLLEERILEDGSLPIGNISANEVDISLNNIKINVNGVDIIDPFFPDNPNSPYDDVLTKNRKVTPYIGFKLADDTFEYVKLGTFWTGDWQVNEQSPVVNVACRDRMELLRRAEYKGSSLLIDTTLYALATEVLTSARDDIPMLDIQWNVDTSLQDFTLPYAWFGKTNYFEAIRSIAEACMGQAYMSRDDVLIIEGPEKTYQS